MTLNDAENLLKSNNVPFELCKYKNEKEYLKHLMLYSNTKYASDNEIIVLEIKSNNNHKNIELEFELVEDNYIFVNLMFGEYDYEMFDWNENTLNDDLINEINKIINGKSTVIIINNLKKKY